MLLLLIKITWETTQQKKWTQLGANGLPTLARKINSLWRNTVSVCSSRPDLFLISFLLFPSPFFIKFLCLFLAKNISKRELFFVWQLRGFEFLSFFCCCNLALYIKRCLRSFKTSNHETGRISFAISNQNYD